MEIVAILQAAQPAQEEVAGEGLMTAFEAHWSKPGYAIDLTRKALYDSSGIYADRLTAAMFASWCAALSAPTTPPQPAAKAEPPAAVVVGKLPQPGGVEISALLDSILTEYNWPSNPKNAARAGWTAAMRYLAARPAAPAEDTARLDWLEQAACDRLSVKVYGSKKKSSFSVELWGDEDDQTMGETLRQAIDAARNKQGSQR